jgi:hypothetical protein
VLSSTKAACFETPIPVVYGTSEDVFSLAPFFDWHLSRPTWPWALHSPCEWSWSEREHDSRKFKSRDEGSSLLKLKVQRKLDLAGTTSGTSLSYLNIMAEERPIPLVRPGQCDDTKGSPRAVDFTASTKSRPIYILQTYPIASALAGSFNNFWIGLGRTHDHGGRQRYLAQFFGNLNAVKYWHLKGEYDDIGSVTSDTFKCGLPIFRRRYNKELRLKQAD